MKSNTISSLKFLLTFGLAIVLYSCETDSSDDSTPIEENNAPNEFALVTIANNSVDVQTLPSFSWETAIDTDGDMVTYDLLLDTNPNPNSIIAASLTSTSYALANELELDTTYYWKVIATDSDGNSTTSTVFQFDTRGIELLTANFLMDGPFPVRSNHTTVTFNNRIWIIGGSISNNVWSSADGVIWEVETENADFSPRELHTSVVFDNKIWVIGGIGFQNSGAIGALNDVWSSSDGINWTLENDNANFPPRFLHSSVVFDNKIWVINGLDSSTYNDVWSSSDGVTWTLINDNPPLASSIVNESLVFDNKMWVLGGNTDNGVTNNVYSSSDGVDWQLVTENPGFSSRNISASAVLDNKMWIFGGETSSGLTNDIWYTSDGISWFEATSGPVNYTTRFGHTTSVLNNKFYIIAGYNTEGSNLNDVWVSEIQ
ncbi:kelch repeat-containing protein [uncultured Dokdonia sp.]|uniref:Kelch repeat-containing protein n=1 Tax=uncultured Dokdonia sp. TaxID=575653 RepID=UPI00262602E5|nr:kelch repeat-containing protein [uncultured Dokdonia sp.]